MFVRKESTTEGWGCRGKPSPRQGKKGGQTLMVRGGKKKLGGCRHYEPMGKEKDWIPPDGAAVRVRWAEYLLKHRIKGSESF